MITEINNQALRGCISVSNVFFAVFTQTLNARCCFYKKIIFYENINYYYKPYHHSITTVFRKRKLQYCTSYIGVCLLQFFQFQKKRRVRAMMLGLPYTNPYNLNP